mgnify:CR=1 FL=1
METEATVSEFQNMLSARGVSRRSFMKLCGAVASRPECCRARCAARGAGPREIRDRRNEGQAVSGYLDRGRVVHGLYRVVCAGRDAGCGFDRAGHDLAQLLRDPVGGSRLVDGGGQGADDRGRQLHPRVRGSCAGRLGGQALRVADKPGTEHLIRGCRESQRRSRAGFLRGQRRLDGRSSQPGGRARRAGVPEEGRHQHAGCERYPVARPTPSGSWPCWRT